MPFMELRRGDDLALDIEFSDRATGDDANLAGWGIEASMVKEPCLPVDLTATFVSAVSGTALIEHPGTETESLEIGEYQMRVRLTSPNGKKTSSNSAIIHIID
jgi:hypothetical protein